MAAAKAKKAVAVDLPECPVCMETMTAPIFQCQSGHSLCNTCTNVLMPPICPICRQPMTQMRNWQLEDIVLKAKVTCPNKAAGCVYTMVNAGIEDHLKECIFREMHCPLGAVFGRCSWHGKLKEMMEHFKDRHAEHCKVTSDTDVNLNNISINEDERHFFLVGQNKLLFIITFKLDTLQKMAYFVVQHIGGKAVAHQHAYEIHVTSNQDERRKVVYTEHCVSDTMKVEEVIRGGKCAVIPLDYLSNFIKDKKLTFRFFIKRITAPAKDKQDKDDDKNKKQDNQGLKGPGPKGPGPNKGCPPKSAKSKGLNCPGPKGNNKANA